VPVKVKMKRVDEDRYAYSIIYKLVSTIDDVMYVGCTTSGWLHRVFYYHTEKRELHHFNMIGWDNVRIVKLEDYPCDTRVQLLERQQYWIDKLKPSINIEAQLKAKRKKDIKAYYTGRSKKLIKMRVRKGKFTIY